jgi:DNA polymerase-3 subunit alpha
MLDGAAKIGLLTAETARLGMPAVGMTDHGNMFGAYEFFEQAKRAGVKPVIGIEAYVAPESRFLKRPVFWGENGGRGADLDGEGGDVSGAGAYTHMTMLAADARGLRNLFRLSSAASIEGYYRKPRMDRELIAGHAEGIIATTGCPGGEVQTRLRLGQPAKALEAAAAYRDIFGKDNFFVEVMDHGVAIEQSVRTGLLDIARRLDLRPLATNDSHYVTKDQAEAHEVLLCVGTGKTLDDPKRFKFNGDGYYLKSPEQMRELWDGQVAGACDSSVLIAERVRPYDEVFASVDRMPKYPVPEGETQASWLRKEVARGIARRFGDDPEQHVLDRISYELGVIEKMGFPAYFLVVADIWSRTRLGHRVHGLVCSGHHRPGPDQALPDLRAVPQPRTHHDARRRPGFRRAPARRHDPLCHREIRRRPGLPDPHLQHDQGEGRGQGCLPGPGVPVHPR